MAGTSSLRRQRTAGKAGCVGCDKATDAPPANWREPWTSDGPRTLVHMTTRSTHSSPVGSSQKHESPNRARVLVPLSDPSVHILASASPSEGEPDGVRTRPQGLRTQRNRAVMAESARRFLRPANRGAARKRRSGLEPEVVHALWAGCGSDDLGKSVDAGAACLRASWKSSVADALRGMSVCQGQGGGASAAGAMPDCSATGRLVAPTITPPLSSKLLVRDSTTVPTNQIVSRRVLGCSNGENDRTRRCSVDSRRSLFLQSRIAAHGAIGRSRSARI